MDSASVGSRHDFAALRAANRDTEGNVLSPVCDRFLDIASAVLERTPSDWTSYFTQPQGDLQAWLNEMEGELTNLKALSGLTLGERATQISARSGTMHNLTAPQLSPAAITQLTVITTVGEAQGGQVQTQSRRISELREEAQTQLGVASQAAQQAQELLRSTQEAAAATTAAGRARLFAREATVQNRFAIVWLAFSALALVGLVALALAFAAGDLIQRPAQNDTFAVANYVLAKVLILGAAAFALTFGTRQYATHRHNATTNRHRSHALSTYRVLVLASRGEDVHDIILKEAADSIFAPQDTGYLKGGSEGGGGAVQIIQGLLRTPGVPHANP